MNKLIALPFLAALTVAIHAASAPSGAAWETWDDCSLETDKYFDGDSFHVRHGGDTAIVRLYFVDAPETDAGYGARVAEQAAYFHTTNAVILQNGAAAKAFTANFLAKPFRVITRRQIAPGASRGERYSAIVERGGQRLDRALIEAGLARATSEVADYPDASTGQLVFQQLRTLEQAAAQAKLGLWSRPTGTVGRVVEVLKPFLPKDLAAMGARRINLNSATQPELESLPGIGPKTAEQIIRARPLKSIEALDAIPGMGPKKIETLRGLVSF